MSLGSELASARAAAGLSLDDVAATTRIRATLIRAIEADDFSGCGGAVYARGHVRSIARAVGIDPEPLLVTFHPAEVAPAAPLLPGGLPGGELLEAEHAIARSTRPERAHWGSLMAATSVVIVALVVYGVMSSGGGKKPAAHVAIGSPSPTVTTSLSATPSAVASTQPPSPSAAAVTTTTASTPTSATPSDVALLPTGVTLELKLTGGRSWFHVADSKGKGLFTGILNKGQTMSFTDPTSIAITIGAPPAVDLVVNGKNIGSLKTKGAVATKVFYPPVSKNAAHG